MKSMKLLKLEQKKVINISNVSLFGAGKQELSMQQLSTSAQQATPIDFKKKRKVLLPCGHFAMGSFCWAQCKAILACNYRCYQQVCNLPVYAIFFLYKLNILFVINSTVLHTTMSTWIVSFDGIKFIYLIVCTSFVNIFFFFFHR
jgi:hypothetical protein